MVSEEREPHAGGALEMVDDVVDVTYAVVLRGSAGVSERTASFTASNHPEALEELVRLIAEQVSEVLREHLRLKPRALARLQ